MIGTTVNITSQRTTSRQAGVGRDRDRGRGYVSKCTTFLLTIVVVAITLPTACLSFELRKVFSGFGGVGGSTTSTSSFTFPMVGGDPTKTKAVRTAKQELVETISKTQNGKESSLETQIKVLGLVDYLESNAPVSETLLTNPKESGTIDGRWYLQYTQPSEPEGVDLNTNIQPWTPSQSTLEETNRLDNRRANNKGAVSFLGVIKVDTSNKVTTQTIGVDTKLFANAVKQDFGTIEVKGFFELDSVPNRIVASFEKGSLTLKNGFVIDFSFLFALRVALKGGLKAGGWLETTSVDETLRIGRGNRGSLFVLTRDQDTVQP